MSEEIITILSMVCKVAYLPVIHNLKLSHRLVSAMDKVKFAKRHMLYGVPLLPSSPGTERHLLRAEQGIRRFVMEQIVVKY